MPVKKILLVQLYSNGDCLYATAVARQIKDDFPDSHLTWAIAPFCRNIILNNPYVDAVEVIDSAPKNDVVAFRRLKKELAVRKKNGEFDEVFVTQNMDTNQAYYDGCIRSGVFSAYPFPVKVPVTPVVRLTDQEMNKVSRFADSNQLRQYDHVILFEFAPQSGQLKITTEMAMEIAEELVKKENTAVILSSGNSFSNLKKGIIDGSVLSIRETAALTKFCSLLLGCSSGISWISTSDAAIRLPMIQMMNAETRWINPISRDFERFHLGAENVIELVDFNTEMVVNCTTLALQNFSEARTKYNQPVPLRFNTTSGIVYNLLCYAEFGAIRNHIRVNRKIYGDNFAFYAQVLKGFLIFPFRLVRNTIVKRFRKA